MSTAALKRAMANIRSHSGKGMKKATRAPRKKAQEAGDNDKPGESSTRKRQRTDDPDEEVEVLDEDVSAEEGDTDVEIVEGDHSGKGKGKAVDKDGQDEEQWIDENEDATARYVRVKFVMTYPDWLNDMYTRRESFVAFCTSSPSCLQAIPPSTPTSSRGFA